MASVLSIFFVGRQISFGTKNVVIPQLFDYFEGKIVHIVIFLVVERCTCFFFVSELNFIVIFGGNCRKIDVIAPPATAATTTTEKMSNFNGSSSN